MPIIVCAKSTPKRGRNELHSIWGTFPTSILCTKHKNLNVCTKHTSFQLFFVRVIWTDGLLCRTMYLHVWSFDKMMIWYLWHFQTGVSMVYNLYFISGSNFEAFDDAGIPLIIFPPHWKGFISIVIIITRGITIFCFLQVIHSWSQVPKTASEILHHILRSSRILKQLQKLLCKIDSHGHNLSITL